MRKLRLILIFALSVFLVGCNGNSIAANSFNRSLQSFEDEYDENTQHVIYNRAQFDFYDSSGEFIESLVKIDTSIVDYEEEYFYFTTTNQLNNYHVTEEVKNMDDFYGLYVRTKDTFNNDIFQGVRLDSDQEFVEILRTYGMLVDRSFDTYTYQNVRRIGNYKFSIDILVSDLINSNEFSFLFSEMSQTFESDQKATVSFLFDRKSESFEISFGFDNVEIEGKEFKANVKYFSKIDIKTPLHNMDLSYLSYRLVLPKQLEDVTYVYESNQKAKLLLTSGENIFAVHVIPGIYKISNRHFYDSNAVITDDENNIYEPSDILYVDHETTLYFNVATTYDLAYYDVNVERLRLQNIVDIKNIILISGELTDRLESSDDVAYYEFVASDVDGYIEFNVVGTNQNAEYWFSSDTLGCSIFKSGLCAILVNADELLQVQLKSSLLTEYLITYEFFPFETVSTDEDNPTDISTLTSGFILDDAQQYGYLSFTVSEEGTYNIDPGVIIKFADDVETVVYDNTGNQHIINSEGFFDLLAGDYIIEYYQEDQYTVMQPTVDIIED